MIALIPARSGSKEIKNKNIKLFKGKPLIAHTIIAAKKSKYIKNIYVITDSKKIGQISKKYGAEVPFLRPKYLAKDNSKAIDTYIFFIQKLKKKKIIDDLIVLLPTSPLRKSQNIDEAIKLYYKNKISSLIGVKEIDFPIEWVKILEKYRGKFVIRNVSQKNNLNRQKYNKYFIPNGSIYIFNISKLLKYKKYYYKDTMPYIMNKENSIDIDDKLDFEIAEFLMKKGLY